MRDNKDTWKAMHDFLELLRKHVSAAGEGEHHLTQSDVDRYTYGIRNHATTLVDKLNR